MAAAFTAMLVYNHSMTALLDLGLHALRRAYCAGTLDVCQVVEEVLKRIAASGDDKVWISRAPDAALRTETARLDARRGDIARLPLYGVPFAVKDNIDVAGLETTAACPSFAYQPQKSAEVVRRLVEAGAIVVGKANLDQFATGLVGVRSPYGVSRNPFDAAFIPGGSSSGSAVAVAANPSPRLASSCRAHNPLRCRIFLLPAAKAVKSDPFQRAPPGRPGRGC